MQLRSLPINRCSGKVSLRRMGEGSDQVAVWGKSVTGSENSKYKALRVKTCLAYVRISKTGYMDGAVTDRVRSWK